MNVFLLSYLDTIDERLLEYLDEDDELSLYAVRRLRLYTSALLDGSVRPGHLVEAWPDWFHLVLAFAAAYGTEEMEQLQDDAVFLRAVGERHGVLLSRTSSWTDRDPRRPWNWWPGSDPGLANTYGKWGSAGRTSS